MSIFVKAVWPGGPKTKEATQVALAYAFVLVVMVVAQLFSFEKFVPLIDSFALPGDGMAAYIVATLLVVCGVLALPFLLRMKLSLAMRVLSMGAGWAIPLLWLGLTIWVNATGAVVSTIGFLGASIPLASGWWAICASLALGILAAWASWGLWPLGGSKKPRS